LVISGIFDTGAGTEVSALQGSKSSIIVDGIELARLDTEVILASLLTLVNRFLGEVFIVYIYINMFKT
jgi:hypothetical protein